jgi:Uma2 family endonuclease
MSTLIVDDVRFSIPDWVRDLGSFRRWTDAPEFPEKGNVWWLNREVWADMSKEQLFTHVMVKGEIFRVLANLAIDHDLGTMYADGLLLTNEEADLSGKPDATFVSHASFASGRVELVEGKSEGFTELVGSPDMTLEVVSDSSVEKDTHILRRDYFAAGVTEYWLVDARGDPLSFEILKRRAGGFVAVRKSGGWAKSPVFGRSFRLTRSENRSGQPKFRLEVK